MKSSKSNTQLNEKDGALRGKLKKYKKGFFHAPQFGCGKPVLLI